MKALLKCYPPKCYMRLTLIPASVRVEVTVTIPTCGTAPCPAPTLASVRLSAAHLPHTCSVGVDVQA